MAATGSSRTIRGWRSEDQAMQRSALRPASSLVFNNFRAAFAFIVELLLLHFDLLCFLSCFFARISLNWVTKRFSKIE